MPDLITVNLHTNHTGVTVTHNADLNIGKKGKFSETVDAAQDFAQIDPTTGNVKIFDGTQLMWEGSVADVAKFNPQDARDIYSDCIAAGLTTATYPPAPSNANPGTPGSGGDYRRPVEPPEEYGNDFGKPLHKGG